ncbi:hypothetical protein BU15DRAFT_81748 [Melanogaster broomeanus]|nr:hypothetical protein BU15DRAFT_81748 [Melanogaster broomeanus]
MAVQNAPSAYSELLLCILKLLLWDTPIHMSGVPPFFRFTVKLPQFITWDTPIHMPGVPPFFRFTVKLPQFITWDTPIHMPGVPPFFRFTVKLPQFIAYALHPNGKGAPVSIGPLVLKLAWSRSTICVGVSPIGASL